MRREDWTGARARRLEAEAGAAGKAGKHLRATRLYAEAARARADMATRWVVVSGLGVAVSIATRLLG